MTGTQKIATRQSYGEALKELGELHPDVELLDADLANAIKTDIFKKAFPNRHFDCGIAESDMVCVAAGLSTTGLVPFASSFAMFAAGRAFEQARNSIDYPHLNVKIGATHGGISVGEDGSSHQCARIILSLAVWVRRYARSLQKTGSPALWNGWASMMSSAIPSPLRNCFGSSDCAQSISKASPKDYVHLHNIHLW